jgi:hypothetical protein
MTARVEDRSAAAKITPCATLPNLHYVTAEKGGIMKFRVVLVASAIGLSCIGAPSSAEPPIGSRLGERLTKDRPADEATSVQQAHALATCLTNKRAPMAKRLLDQMDDKSYTAAYKVLIGGELQCDTGFMDSTTPFLEGRVLQVPRDIFRGLLSEELIRHDVTIYAALLPLPRQLTYSRSWYSASGRDVSVDEMATCVSEIAPAESLALIKTLPNSDAEGSAFAAVVPYMGACLRAGVKLTGNRQSLRAAVADALYQRIANPAPVPTAAAPH